ncbi:MAG: acetyl-CoA carboxylase carboxyltransferase subunit alpha [Verrucomicrobia bacterium]|nr:acetyl-CoA carboxylase carboxyltransferase subunit alpha [Verrucomicrobiota bacterium]MBU4291731.1 acetyl-CoA carboxylase carboxyltransferase subunit alpha [Verrucomicrobiota bacterium]MBU4427782.1 acetyl-CoA carboxylase carboxyltransferase subunit alpha [Verrucomicrobiota bacterium]MCG2681282.1 acetyl-CoA carboxylase carboxyltransferase subunit alpha [Kiritimatiellia bacterium]
MAHHSLSFEKPILELETKLKELRAFSEAQDIDVSRELSDLERKIVETKRQVFKNLTAWDEVQLARHPQRPYTLDYIGEICRDFVELHGDRHYGDDRAIVGGFAMLDTEAVMIIGTQKGRDVKSNVERNFGMAYPEGYRKALRLMKLAAKFGRPIVVMIDTAGAYPGVGSEERQIAEAIAMNLREAFLLPVPIIVTVIGEGGSGGALGIGVGDRILILEHSYYSVISPEGCAAILWRDRAFASKAAAALKLTSRDLLKAGLVDEIIPEPLGGAHTDPKGMAADLRRRLLYHLRELKQYSLDELLDRRYRKFRAMGVIRAESPSAGELTIKNEE